MAYRVVTHLLLIQNDGNDVLAVAYLCVSQDVVLARFCKFYSHDACFGLVADVSLLSELINALPDELSARSDELNARSALEHAGRGR